MNNGGMAKKRTKRPTMSEQIRQAIRECGDSRYEIAKQTGLSQAALSRFMSGERGLPMKTLDRLAKFLRLWITIEGPHKGMKGKT